MILPDDFGFDPLATLTHTNTTPRPARFQTFWSAWGDRVLSQKPSLAGRPLDRADPRDASASHEFASMHDAVIGCRLIEPVGDPRAIAVVLHGYAGVAKMNEDTTYDPLAASGYAVAVLRVRGFAGSSLPDRVTDDGQLGWITQGLIDDDAWIVPHAVADVVQLVRSMRARYGDLPTTLIGSSLGGGLAIIAASRMGDLALRGACATLASPIDKLVLRVPSFGDWLWRSQRPGFGAGAELDMFATTHSTHRDGSPPCPIYERAGLADAALHATTVYCPTLCLLALRDETVPAPTAAAIFNALGTPRLLKHRRIAPYGHFEGGIANAKRHTLFERETLAWLEMMP